jgi:hypothetical protein
MPPIVSKEDIITASRTSFTEFASFCLTINDADFFRQPATKWSIAQNVTHLITSATMTRLAYRLPKFIVRIYTGKPNRPSRSYDELVVKYKLKLEQGGRASGRFVARPVPASQGKEKIMDGFNRAMDKLVATMEKNWKDPQLDQYLAPHPLLGKITLRELGYFTIYHTLHHLQIIKERLSD